MNIDPTTALKLNAVLGVLTGLSLPVLQNAGFANSNQILAWSTIAALALNGYLHAYSSPASGPWAGPPK
jgi:hypothetical protein